MMAIQRAYVIKGDIMVCRRLAQTLSMTGQSGMYSVYEDRQLPNQLGILFADQPTDFINKDLDKIVKLAGNTKLNSNFHKSKTADEKRFGVITL